jgi:hypothetical protein
MEEKMDRLSKFVSDLDQNELMLVKKELEAGNFERLLAQKIKETKEQDWNKVCPVCHSPIEEGSMTLTFGPKDLRKKASFCARDCLKYFVQRLEEQVKN